MALHTRSEKKMLIDSRIFGGKSAPIRFENAFIINVGTQLLSQKKRFITNVGCLLAPRTSQSTNKSKESVFDIREVSRLTSKFLISLFWNSARPSTFSSRNVFGSVWVNQIWRLNLLLYQQSWRRDANPHGYIRFLCWTLFVILLDSRLRIIES